MHQLRNAVLVAALWWLAALTSHAATDENPYLPPLVPPASPSPYSFTREADLATWPGWSELEAATLKHADLKRGAFGGAGSAKIHYRLYQHRHERHGAIVLVPGRTEGLVLYQELIHDLVRNGWSVYIHDHRGQGFSQRLLADDATIGYVEDFNDYVADLAAFIAGPVREARADSKRPVFLLAHSMGGAISALYLQTPRSDGIAAAALVTPMMEPWVASGTSPGVAERLVDNYCEKRSSPHGGPLGRLLANRYADGAPFDDEYAELRQKGFGTDNNLTHSAVRFARHWEAHDQARCAGADCGAPNAKVGGVSFRWLNQACIGSQQARSEAAGRIRLPVLLLQGEADTVVKPSAQKTFCKHLNTGTGPGYCVGLRIPQARHAIFIEADAYRVPALNAVLGFFDCVAAGRAARCGE